MEVKYILGISVFVLLAIFTVVWSSMGVNPLYSFEVDMLCDDNDSILYRNGTAWGCGSFDTSSFNINMTNITIVDINESDPLFINWNYDYTNITNKPDLTQYWKNDGSSTATGNWDIRDNGLTVGGETSLGYSQTSLITNNEFDNSLTGWTDSGSSWSSVSDTDNYASTALAGSTLTSAFTPIIGKKYILKYKVVTTGLPFFHMTVGGYTTSFPSYSAGSYDESVIFTATTTAVPTMWDSGFGAGNVKVYNFEVNELQETDIPILKAYLSKFTILQNENSIGTAGKQSLGLGYNSEASGLGAVALGYNSKATGAYSTAIGTNTQATQLHSTAIGYGMKSTGGTATHSIGYNVENPNAYSLGIGFDTLDYLFTKTDFHVKQDNHKVVMGAGDDVGMWYDGTNWIFDTKLAGTGYMNIQGDVIIDESLAVGANTLTGLSNGDANFSTVYYDTLTAKSPTFLCSEQNNWCSVTVPEYQETLYLKYNPITWAVQNISFKENFYTPQEFYSGICNTNSKTLDVCNQIKNKIEKLQNKKNCDSKAGYLRDSICYKIEKSTTIYENAVISYQKEITITEEYNCNQLNNSLQIIQATCSKQIGTGFFETHYKFKNNCGYDEDYYCNNKILA